MLMQFAQKSNETEQGRVTASAVLQNFSQVLTKLGVGASNVAAVSIIANAQGRFSVELADNSGQIHNFSGSMQNGELSGSQSKSIVPNGALYEFVSAQSAGIIPTFAKTEYDFASNAASAANSNFFIQSKLDENSKSSKINYLPTDASSISGGIEKKFIFSIPLAEEPAEGGSGVAFDFKNSWSSSALSTQPWAEFLNQARYVKPPNYVIANPESIELEKTMPKPPEQNSEQLSVSIAPSTSYTILEKRQVLLMYDLSETSNPNLPAIDKSVNILSKQLSSNGDYHGVANLPDDRESELAKYTVIDNNRAEFEKFMRSKYTDASIQAFFAEKRAYQNGETQDNDGYSVAIHSFIDNYGQPGSPNTLVLYGDGGNQYRRLYYNPNARKDQQWGWEFDTQKYERDLAKVKQFSSEHPEAKIYFIQSAGLPPKSILDAPLDTEQIATLAQATGTRRMSLTSPQNPASLFPPQPPLVLVPKYLNATLSVIPSSFNPFFSAEAGSTTYYNTSGTSLTDMGRPINVRNFIHTGKTGYEHLDDDMYNRKNETVHLFDKGMFPFLGRHDLVGKALPFSLLLDKYNGLERVDAWASSIVDYANQNNLRGKELSDAITSHFSMNSAQINNEVWGANAEEFSQFGKTGAGLLSLRSFMSESQYYRDLMRLFPYESAGYKLAKSKYDDLTDAAIGYYTRPLMHTSRDVSLYESLAWDYMYSLATMKNSTSYFKLFFHSGETASKNIFAKKLGSRTPRMSLWIGAAYNPIASSPSEQGTYVQFHNFFQAGAGMILNEPLFSKNGLSLDFNAELAAGVLFPTNKNAGVEFIPVNILEKGYMGQWPLGNPMSVGAFKAGLNLSYVPESKSYAATMQASIDGLPTSWLLGIADQSMREKSIAINPALNHNVPPNTIKAGFALPVWNKLYDATGACLNGAVSGQIVPDGFVVKNFSLSATATPWKSGPIFSLQAGGEGFTGVNSMFAIAEIMQKYNGWQAGLSYRLKAYLGENAPVLTKLGLEIKYELSTP